jgi:hypothetical protein
VARNVSVRVEVHISGSLYSRIKFKPEAITEGYLKTIRQTVIDAADFAARVNREDLRGYRTLLANATDEELRKARLY